MKKGNSGEWRRIIIRRKNEETGLKEVCFIPYVLSTAYSFLVSAQNFIKWLSQFGAKSICESICMQKELESSNIREPTERAWTGPLASSDGML